MERHSFRIVSGDSPETLRKLCHSAKFPHQEIRRNYGILCGGYSLCNNSMLQLTELMPRMPTFITQKMKFYIKDFFSKCDQIRSFLRLWSHLLKKYLMEKFIFSAVIAEPHFAHSYLL